MIAVLKNKYVKGFAGLGAMRLMSMPMGLLTTILLARYLGPDGYGQYAFMMALVPMLSLLLAGGLPQLLTREIAGYTHTGEWSYYKGALRASLVWVTLSGLVVLFFIYIAYFFFLQSDRSGKWSLLPIAALIIPFVGLNAVRNGVTKGLGKPFLAEFPSQIVQPCVLIAAVFLFANAGGINPVNAMWAQLLSVVVSFLIATYFFLKIKPSGFEAQERKYDIKKWGASMLPFMLLSLVSVFNTQIGIIILGFLAENEDVAILRIADRGAHFIALSLAIVNIVVAPEIVKAYKSGNRDKLQTISRRGARAALLAAMPIAFIFIAFGSELIEVVFGEEYVGAYMPLVILAVGQLANVFFGSVGNMLSMSGYEKDTLKGQVVAVLVNIILCLMMIPSYGAIGAAIAASSGLLVWNVILALKVIKRLDIRPSAL